MKVTAVAFSLAIAFTLACAAGCQSLSSVQGWDGPQLEVRVDASGGELVMLAPTAGWTLTIDRAKQTAGGVTLWVTAHRPDGITSQAITRVRTRWTPGNKADPMPDCMDVRMRINDGMYVPAAEGCR